MDSVSQALWGGLSAVALRKKTKVRHDFILGAIGGTLPDLDAWVGRLSSPLDERLWHRGPSHSLILLGLIGAALVWYFKRFDSRIVAKLMPLWIGSLTHPLLDILTGFETAWAYPLLEPMSVGWFPVLEPIFLSVLLIGAGSTLVRSSIRSARIWLLVALCWIAAVGGYHQWVHRSVLKDLSSRLEASPNLLIRPMLGSFLTYRVLWKTDDVCHIAAYQPWNRGGLYSSIMSHPRVTSLSDASFSVRLLKQGCFREVEPAVYGDLRFALLPSSDLPLWVWFQGENGEWQREARRTLSPQTKELFFSLWRGTEQPGWYTPQQLLNRSAE